MRGVQVLHLGGHGKAQPAVGAARVAGVGVLQRVGTFCRPGQAQARRADHRAPACGPHRLLLDRVQAVAAQQHARHAALRHLLGLTIDDVAGGVALGQGQLMQRETLAGGHRVRPGHVLVEADVHHRAEAGGRAHHIHLARHRDVHLPEAVDTRPGEMRVAQQQALAGAGGILAKSPGVGAQRRVDEAQRAGFGLDLRHGHGRQCRGLGGGRGLRRQHGVGQRADAGLHAGHFVEPVEVRRRHRQHPGLALARGRQLAALVGQEAVVAGYVAAHHCLRVGAGRGPAACQGCIVHVRGDEDVDLLIGQHTPAQQRGGGGAEVARTFAAHRQQLLRGLAHVVLRVRIGHAVG